MKIVYQCKYGHPLEMVSETVGICHFPEQGLWFVWRLEEPKTGGYYKTRLFTPNPNKPPKYLETTAWSMAVYSREQALRELKNG